MTTPDPLTNKRVRLTNGKIVPVISDMYGVDDDYNLILGQMVTVIYDGQFAVMPRSRVVEVLED